MRQNVQYQHQTQILNKLDYYIYIHDKFRHRESNEIITL